MKIPCLRNTQLSELVSLCRGMQEENLIPNEQMSRKGGLTSIQEPKPKTNVLTIQIV